MSDKRQNSMTKKKSLTVFLPFYGSTFLATIEPRIAYTRHSMRSMHNSEVYHLGSGENTNAQSCEILDHLILRKSKGKHNQAVFESIHHRIHGTRIHGTSSVLFVLPYGTLHGMCNLSGWPLQLHLLHPDFPAHIPGQRSFVSAVASCPRFRIGGVSGTKLRRETKRKYQSSSTFPFSSADTIH